MCGRQVTWTAPTVTWTRCARWGAHGLPGDILSETDEEISARSGGGIIVGDGPQQDATTLSGVVLKRALRLQRGRRSRHRAERQQFGAHRLGERDLAPGIHWWSGRLSSASPDMAEGHARSCQTPHSFGLGIGQGAAVALARLVVEVWGSSGDGNVGQITR